jgi:hypothetical protein
LGGSVSRDDLADWRFGGIKWQALKEMIRTVPEISGVQIMNDADDWLVFDREALGLNPSDKWIAPFHGQGGIR